MSSITADGRATPIVNDAGSDIGPLEQKHLQYANYRAVADTTEITKTHWHIATANALGWGYFVGFVPFVSIALQQHTGSFALAFLCIPVLMIAMAIGVYLFVPEHSGKELNEISE